MVDHLDGVRIKMARSREHIDALLAETSQFIADNPIKYRREADDDPVPGWAFYVNWAEIPGRFGAIIGDALTNMRAALDHLAWQLFLATNPPPTKEKVYFPIRLTEPSPKGLAAMVAKVRPTAAPIIEAVQPYQNIAVGQLAEVHPLAVLNLLVNTDKHRTLTVTEMFGAESDIRVTGRGGSPLFGRVEAPGGVATDKLGWLPAEVFPKDEPWEILAKIAPILAIDVGNRRMEPILEMLHRIHRWVQGEVVEPLEAACFKNRWP